MDGFLVKVKLEEAINKNGHMRLAASLSRNIMETLVGGILYKFKLRERRHTLFFGEISAEYFKECERCGYGSEMRVIGRKWGALIVKQLMPAYLKILSPILFFNKIMRKIWVNLGLVSRISMTMDDDIIEIRTENEGMTELIGKNEFMVGFYEGILSILFRFNVDCIDAFQTKESCKYTFKVTNKPFDIRGKEIETYKKLNYLSKINGFTLKDALRKNIFQLKSNNKLFFRGKVIYPIESTVTHLVSNSEILLDKVQHISYKFFSEVVDAKSSTNKKLTLLKTLIQTMGWGAVKIRIDDKTVTVEISNPPYGLQVEKDNWSFLSRIILGYLWLIDNRFKIREVNESYKVLTVRYTV